jgi:hypothetical protein
MSEMYEDDYHQSLLAHCRRQRDEYLRIIQNRREARARLCHLLNAGFHPSMENSSSVSQ